MNKYKMEDFGILVYDIDDRSKYYIMKKYTENDLNVLFNDISTLINNFAFDVTYTFNTSSQLGSYLKRKKNAIVTSITNEFPDMDCITIVHINGNDEFYTVQTYKKLNREYMLNHIINLTDEQI